MDPCSYIKLPSRLFDDGMWMSGAEYGLERTSRSVGFFCTEIGI